MDVYEDYVWLWVILEFIFFLVMGLECVGDWLLVGEVWVEVCVSREEIECLFGVGL